MGILGGYMWSYYGKKNKEEYFHLKTNNLFLFLEVLLLLFEKKIYLIIFRETLIKLYKKKN